MIKWGKITETSQPANVVGALIGNLITMKEFHGFARAYGKPILVY